MDFFGGLWFPMPVFVIFFLDQGLNLFHIGILFGASTLVQFLLEIPSSVWADKYSRRTVLLWGAVFAFFCDLTLGLSSSFHFFFLALVFSGIGNALFSGTFSALVYDTLLSLGREKEYERVNSKIMRNFFLGRAFASVFGVWMYTISPHSVFFLAALVNLVYILIVLSTIEPYRERSISTPLRQVREGINFLRGSGAIWNLVIIFALMVATSDVLFTYYQPVLRSAGTPVLWLGSIYFFINLMGFLGAGRYLQVKARLGWKNFMIFFLLADIVASIFLGTEMFLLAAAAIIILSLSFSWQNTYISNIINESVPSSHRATSLSIYGQMYMLLYSVFINIVGFSVESRSMIFGMSLNALVVLVVLAAFLIVFRSKTLPLGENTPA